jgi:hypothetical protein
MLTFALPVFHPVLAGSKLVCKQIFICGRCLTHINVHGLCFMKPLSRHREPREARCGDPEPDREKPETIAKRWVRAIVSEA